MTRVRKVSLKLNVASGVMLLGVQLVVSFILAPFFLRTLGAESYGLWELVISLLGYASLLEFGLGAAMIRETAAADGAGDPTQVSRVFSNAAAVLGTAGVVAAAIMLAVSPVAGALMGSPVALYTETSLATAITALNVVATFAVTILAALAMGLQEFLFLNMFRIVSISLSAAVTIAVLTRWPDHGLVNLALVACVGNLVQVLVLARLVRRRVDLRFDRALVSRPEIARLFRFGINSTILESASKIVNGAAPFVVTHVIGLASVPLFAVGKRLVDYGYSLGSVIGNPLMPHFASQAAEGVESLRQSWLRTTKFLQMVTLAMPVGIFLYGPAFLSLWMGSDFAANARVIVEVLSFGMVFQAISCNCGALIVSKGLHAGLARFALLSAIPCLAISALLGGTLGLLGIALGIAAFPIALGIKEVRLANEILGQTFRTGQWLTVRPYLVPLAGMLVTGLVLRTALPPITYPRLFVGAATCAGVYALLVLCVAFDSDERRMALGRFHWAR